MYHSVPAPDTARWIDPSNAVPMQLFELQMRYLHRRRRVVSMKELLDAKDRANEMPAGTVVLTFDDGYLDNLSIVAPILQRYNFPSLLYLATEYVNSGRAQWIDELYAMFLHRTNHELLIGEKHLASDLKCARRADKVYRYLRDELAAADAQKRESILARVAQQLRPDAKRPRLTINWGEVRELVRRYPRFEVGAHTADHLDLRAHSDRAEEQIGRSVADIERELGIRPVHFSFPYGRYNPESQRAAKKLGMDSAVVAGTELLIGPKSDRFGLPRIPVPESLSLLGYYTGGAHPI
jgi:peptidoglycan/xylan/chitin deacetylase (PgdA/CDA1 family)